MTGHKAFLACQAVALLPIAIPGPALVAGAWLVAAPRDAASICLTLVTAHGHDVLWAAIPVAALTGVLVVRFGAGLVTLVARTLHLVRGRRRQRLHSVPDEAATIADSLGVQDRLEVVLSDEIFAWCHGLLRPRLLVSSALIGRLRPPELEAVLRHEAAHLRSRDPLRIALAKSFQTACGFVPGLRRLGAEYLKAIEIRADRVAVEEMGDRLPLASALHRLLTTGPSTRHPDGLALGSLSVTEARIEQLLTGADWESRTSGSRLLALGASLLVLFSLAICAGLSAAVQFGPAAGCLACR